MYIKDFGGCFMNTQKIILSAFHDLMEKKSIDTISVGEILESAEVSKPTFYRYFYNKYDLLEQWFGKVLRPLTETGEGRTWRDALTETFRVLNEEYLVFHRAFKSSEEQVFRDSVMIRLVEQAIFNTLEDQGADIHDLHITFAVRSATITHASAMRGWAGDKNRGSIDQTVDLILSTVPDILRPYLTDPSCGGSCPEE